MSWTASLSDSVVGYRVHYSIFDGKEKVTGILSSTGISTDITGLTNGKTYNFSVEVITSNMLPGISEEMTITLGESIAKYHSLSILFSLQYIALETPEDTEVIAGSASVRVFWEAVTDADIYVVTFSEVQAADQQGLCSTDFHIASLIVDSLFTTVSIAVGENVESTVTDMLRAFTTYEVTVKAASDIRGISQPSEARRVLTPQLGENN